MITIKIETDNAAFSDNEALEVARILNNLTAKICFNEQVERGRQTLRDLNGNTVGSIEVS